MKDVVILIPVYKPFCKLNDSEILSLRQLKKILGYYPICLAVPDDLAVEEYVQLFKKSNLLVERFDKSYFRSIKAYNRLCLSKDFYKRFLSYRYMLIYQIDAYVFRDELSFWISKGYDYIGAPYYYNNSLPFDIKTWSVGNGGLSLRSVSRCFKLIEKIELYGLLIALLQALGLKKLVTKALIKLGLINLAVVDRICLNKYNEDEVFGLLSKKLMRNFVVAPIDRAMQFSFEAHPSLMYEMNEKKLPFGCHAWSTYEADFWKQFIQQTG